MLPFVNDDGLVGFIMILYEFKDQRFDLIPVGLFFLRNGDEVLAEEDMRDTIDSKQIASQRRYFVCLLKRRDIHRFSSAHNKFIGGHKLQKIRVGCFMSVDEERVDDSGYYFHQ